MSTAYLKQLAFLALALALFALFSGGCNTEAYCFTCGTDATSTTSATGTGGSSGTLGGGGDNCIDCSGTGGQGGCLPTNGGIETCDHLDNDCNGKLDDVAGIDFASPSTCGTCDNNCYTKFLNADPTGITCAPSADPGATPGTCNCGGCAQDYFDLDGDCSCEYYCLTLANDDTLCNNKDDDCDGLVDEDVDVCADAKNCGGCNVDCVVLHGQGACAWDGNTPCSTATSTCQIGSCDCAPGACYWDLDGVYATGCEYACELTNGGVEICGDAIDNDCDGKLDDADDLSGDPAIGVTCYGDPDGECATAAHAGATACVGSQVVCVGAAVLTEDAVQETCNGKDDDCDGVVDDGPTDAGGACGASPVFPCKLGAYVCQSGQLACVGDIPPGVESCNGIDDDCDGQIDKANGAEPADAMGPCNVPPPAPAGATQPCAAGALACLGGVAGCVGSVGPTSLVDGCGDDSNCDGQLTGQPDTQSDVSNCGGCNNDCYTNAVHAVFACVGGMCQFQGCQAGYYDLNNDGQCEYACTYIQAQEICNGTDDNCNGTIDENVVAPSPVQVCGVNPSATSAECTSQVTVSCQNGTFVCGFPAGVCSPTCATATEVCDTLDNNCNGLLNENVPSFGQPCGSDDGLPAPGHGACRTTGVQICNGPQATMCSAVKASCQSLPAGCTEVCDGIDNDCDGTVDEPFSAKGVDPAYFVKPTVTKITSSLWIYTYEGSRPNATSQSAGSGNGYTCTGASCVGVPAAPAGVPLEKNASCSQASRIPWFNVTPIEAEQICQARGGSLCSTANWTTACQATQPCTYGYAPRGAACTSTWFPDPPGAALGKFCNLGLSFDADPVAAGMQHGVLMTASSKLQNCYGDWTSLQGNQAGSDKLFDITGNLREITKSAVNTYPLMGGSYLTDTEAGATCSFTFYTVDQNFQLFDLGFRCCFTADPRL